MYLFKTYAFIDSQNLNLGVRSQGWKLDWRKFRQYLRNKYNVEKAFLFIGYKSGNENLYASLEKYGYIVILKPTQKLPNGLIKGNVDAELVLHAMIEYQNYDKAIIVSGDGDFYCLAEYLEMNSKLLKILVPRSRYSGLFREFNKRDYVIQLGALRKSLENKRTGICGRSKP